MLKSVCNHVGYGTVVGYVTVGGSGGISYVTVGGSGGISYVTVGGSSGGIFAEDQTLSVGTSTHSEYIRCLRSGQRKETIAARRQWRPQ